MFLEIDNNLCWTNMFMLWHVSNSNFFHLLTFIPPSLQGIIVHCIRCSLMVSEAFFDGQQNRTTLPLKGLSHGQFGDLRKPFGQSWGVTIDQAKISWSPSLYSRRHDGVINVQTSSGIPNNIDPPLKRTVQGSARATYMYTHLYWIWRWFCSMSPCIYKIKVLVRMKQV